MSSSEPPGDEGGGRPSLEILISLQDRPYELIRSGVKTFEFRRRWKIPAATAYIYRSGKQRKLCALVELGTPVYGTADEVAAIAERMLPGNGATVAEYLAATGGGYAIPIKGFREFPAIKLAELRMLGVHPPQYYTYISRHPRLKKKLVQRLGEVHMGGGISADVKTAVS